MNSLSRPAPYVRGMRPVLGGDAPFIMEELRRIEQTLKDLADFAPQEADTAPARPRVGMQRLSVDPWRPLGGTVDRWVYWSGTAWVAL